MIFGDGFAAPASADAAGWLPGACRGRFGTVGGLVPNDFDAYICVAAPDPDIDDWWDDCRTLFEIVQRVARTHTSTPDEAWFAIWDGYGWGSGMRLYTLPRFAGPLGRLRIRVRRARLQRRDERRRAAVRAALSSLPRFEMPSRRYYLVAGAAGGVGSLRSPSSPDRWQRPELWWPADRRWFVATDVDFWSLYIGGPAALIADLTGAVPTEVETVSLDTGLVAED